MVCYVVDWAGTVPYVPPSAGGGQNLDTHGLNIVDYLPGGGFQNFNMTDGSLSIVSVTARAMPSPYPTTMAAFWNPTENVLWSTQPGHSGEQAGVGGAIMLLWTTAQIGLPSTNPTHLFPTSNQAGSYPSFSSSTTITASRNYWTIMIANGNSTSTSPTSGPATLHLEIDCSSSTTAHSVVTATFGLQAWVLPTAPATAGVGAPLVSIVG